MVLGGLTEKSRVSGLDFPTLTCRLILMDLYHTDIRLPANFVAPAQTVTVDYSDHARKAAHNDRYGFMDLPYTLPLRSGKVIEVGMENGRVAKILFRFQYDNDLDMCIVLIPGRWFAKTVWFNERTDSHKTLDRSKYVA